MAGHRSCRRVGLNELLHAIFEGIEVEMNAKFVATVLSMAFTPYKGL